MCTVDIFDMPTVTAQRLNLSLNHIELVTSSISSAIVGGSKDIYTLIPDDDMGLARAVVGLAQSHTEYMSMMSEGEVEYDG